VKKKQSPGPTTCGGFPGNGGHFAADVAAMAAAGVDYFKADGCNAATADLPALYKSLAAALAASGRNNITLSCSWPAYLPDARAVRRSAHSRHPLPPIPYDALAATCHAWRNWVDIDTTPASVAAIAGYWAYAARKSPGFASSRRLPGPGAWHDPDQLLVGEPALPFAWQAAQFALWCVWGAPLFLSADVRAGTGGVSAEARSLALDAELVAINQRGAGGPVLVACGDTGGKGKLRGCGRAQAWARPLEGGAVALVAARLEDQARRGGGVLPAGAALCVPVREILRAAARVWPQEPGTPAAASSAPPPPPPHPRARALCWRAIPLTPRAEPRRAPPPWTGEAAFPHTARLGEDLCLDVGAQAGGAAAVVGRPCGRTQAAEVGEVEDGAGVA